MVTKRGNVISLQSWSGDSYQFLSYFCSDLHIFPLPKSWVAQYSGRNVDLIRELLGSAFYTVMLHRYWDSSLDADFHWPCLPRLGVPWGEDCFFLFSHLQHLALGLMAGTWHMITKWIDQWVNRRVKNYPTLSRLKGFPGCRIFVAKVGGQPISDHTQTAAPRQWVYFSLFLVVEVLVQYHQVACPFNFGWQLAVWNSADPFNSPYLDWLLRVWPWDSALAHGPNSCPLLPGWQSQVDTYALRMKPSGRAHGKGPSFAPISWVFLAHQPCAGPQDQTTAICHFHRRRIY